MGASAKRQISEEELSRWRLIEEFEWRLEKAAAVGKSRAPFAFTRLAGKQTLLFVHLLLQVVDLRTAPHQFFVGRNKQAYDYEPDRNHDQNEKNPVQSLPNGSFATRAEIAVRVVHSAECSAV